MNIPHVTASMTRLPGIIPRTPLANRWPASARPLAVAVFITLIGAPILLAADSTTFRAGPLFNTNTALRAMTQAQMLLNAMTRGDTPGAAALMDPAVLEATGGVEGLAASIRTLGMDANYDCTITGVPCLAEAEDQTYAVVTTRSRMTSKGEKVRMDSYLIGVSSDQGWNWRFMNGSDKAKTRLLTQTPSLAPYLQFPVRVMRTGDSVFTEVAGQWVPDAATRAAMKRALEPKDTKVPPAESPPTTPRGSGPTDAAAQYALGLQYKAGEGVRKDFIQAEIWLSRAADQGHAKALLEVGRLYWMGDGLVKDGIEGCSYWMVAAALGDEDGKANVEMCRQVFSPGAFAEAQRRGRLRIEALKKRIEEAGSNNRDGI